MQSQFTKQNRHPAQAAILFFALSIVLTFTGCIPFAFSPEAAASREVLNQNRPDFNVDPGSVKLLQTLELNGSNFVMIYYEGVRANSGRESCLFLYNVRKSPIGGFVPGSGGGSCSNAKPDPASQPITMGGNRSGGSGAGDPGYSAINGQVFREDIQTVQVTWSDDTTQQAAVIHQSYLVARTGQFDWKKVEGLNADQQVVYSNDFSVDPSKQ